MKEKKSFVDRLKERWNLNSSLDVLIVLFVFACTGTTVLYIKEPILNWLGMNGERTWWQNLLYLLAVLPVYNLILLFYGFLLGKFNFFWEFEKKTWKRITGKK
jgi:hypothetical protein